MFQAILIKWALDAVMQLLVTTIEEKVKDKKSKVTKIFAKTFIDEQDQIKVEVLDLIKRKVK